jgi:hypothetical protein
MSTIHTYVESLFCHQAYAKGNIDLLVVSHVVTVIVLLSLACLIIGYARRHRQSPIRERAPLLSIMQMLGFYGLLLQSYSTEIFLQLDEEPWGDTKGFWRCFNKSVYISLRVVAYTIFILR